MGLAGSGGAGVALRSPPLSFGRGSDLVGRGLVYSSLEMCECQGILWKAREVGRGAVNLQP